MEVTEVETKSNVDSSAKPYFIISHSDHIRSVTGHNMYLFNDLEVLVMR